MPREKKAKRYGVSELADSRVLRKCQGLYKGLLIALIGGDVTALGNDCFNITLYLSPSLRMVGSRCHVQCTQMGTQETKQFFD